MAAHRIRRWQGSAIVLSVALALALALGACGAGHPGAGATTASGSRASVPVGTQQIRTGGPRVSGLGDAFAGLVWFGALTSVGASWRVPVIRAGSQMGRAATWIGAQGFGTLDPAHPTQSAPFIQIGTQEELLSSAGAPELVDEAFWTDIVRGLHPVPLFPVHPGDAVDARMTVMDRRWTLTISDRTTGRARRVSTGEEGAGRFSLALWLQEDPTSASTNRVFSYPDLAPVHMSGLIVNSSRPAAGRLKTTWMALPHAYLAPTPPSAGAFTVAPHALSLTGARYLRITAPADAAVSGFSAAAARWRAATPARVIDAAIRRLVKAIAGEASRLRSVSWPPAVRAPIRRLTDGYAREATALGRGLSRGARSVLAALPHGGDAAAQAALAQTIRRRLGLPLFSY